MALWQYKSMLCVLQAYSCYLKSERAWAISLTPRLRRKQKCAARPGRRPRCGWRLAKSMWNRALTWMHPTCADRWEKTWPIKVELAWKSTQRLSKHSGVFLQNWFSNYTEWWWCVKVKTVHGMMSRKVPKVAHSVCFNRTELNAPLPPLVAHVATPDGTHQESMCN